LRQKTEEYRSAVLDLQQRWRDVREKRFQRRIGIAIEAITGFQAVARGLLVRKNYQDLRSGNS